MLFFTGLPAQCPMVPIAMYIGVHIAQLGVDQDQNTKCMSDVHIFPPMGLSSSNTKKCKKGSGDIVFDVNMILNKLDKRV